MSVNDPILLYEAELRQAQLASDIEALDRLLDDALIFTTAEGMVVSKADDLNLHKSGQLRITKMNPLDHHILHLGETIVVIVGMDAEATINGAVVGGILRYTRVWHQRPGGWRVIAGHMSAVQV